MPKSEFFLASIQTNPDKVGEYIQEAKAMGVDILAPDINKSNTDISIVDGAIYYGLHNVKNVGIAAADYLVKLREKHTFKSREHLENIIEDNMILHDAGLLTGKSPRATCNKRAIDSLQAAGCFDNLEPFDLMERAELQKEYLGVSFVDVYTPLTEQFSDAIKGYKPFPLAETEGYGIVSEVEHKVTSPTAKAGFANKPYIVVTVEWRMETRRLTVFEGSAIDRMQPGTFWLIQARVNAKGATFQSGKMLA